MLATWNTELSRPAARRHHNALRGIGPAVYDNRIWTCDCRSTVDNGGTAIIKQVFVNSVKARNLRVFVLDQGRPIETQLTFMLPAKALAIF